MKEKLSEQEDTEDTERKRRDSRGWKGGTIYFTSVLSPPPGLILPLSAGKEGKIIQGGWYMYFAKAVS